MKIVVCIKQVPDTSEVEIDPQTNTLIRTGIPVIINPDDKSGIEAALTLRDRFEGSTVTAVSMGPRQADIVLREALGMGCDNAVLVSDRRFGGSDTLATSTILASAIKKIGCDLIITGRQACKLYVNSNCFNRTIYSAVCDFLLYIFAYRGCIVR